MNTIRLIAGMGNQLFQTAMIFSHSKKYQINYCVPTKVIAPHIPGKEAYRFAGINYLANPPELQEYKEKSFRYEEIPPVDNVCFNGYWQSWKYFDEYREELLEALGFPYKADDSHVAIHVRRGDYLQYPNHHPTITPEYLAKAIRFMRQRGYYQFKVFSDDLQWCRETLGDSKNFTYVEGQDEMQDLIDMSCCAHQIGSNSSYSFWGYYLNKKKDKIGIFPKKWFGPALSHDISDLILPNSILM